MRLVVVYRYFWPDAPPYATMLHRICEALAKEGHEIIVLTGQPSYGAAKSLPRQPAIEVMSSNLTVKRCSFLNYNVRGMFGRAVEIFNWGWYFIWCLYQTFVFRFSTASKPQLVWTASIPPVMQGVLGRILSRILRARYLYHVQDIYPEALPSGHFLNRFSAILRKLDTASLENAQRVVTLSSDMKSTLLKRAGGAEIAVINNFSLFDTDITPAKREATKSGNKVRFIFAGNLGRFQNLDLLVDAMQKAIEINANLELHFMGHGKLKHRLEAKVRNSKILNIFFHDFLAAEDAFKKLSEFDVSIVSIGEGVLDVAYPSKTFTYLAAGLPVLALCEREFELAQLLDKLSVGHSVSPSDIDIVKDGILKMGESYLQYSMVAQKTQHIWGQQPRIDEWCSLIKDIEREQRNGS